MTIAQSIRTAALQWPLGFFGDVESRILFSAFSTVFDHPRGEVETIRLGKNHFRVFCLFVALALE